MKKLCQIFICLCLLSISSIASALTPAEIYKNYSNSVVTVLVLTNDGMASGSGFFIETTGLLITNAHVIQKAKDISVVMQNGESYVVRAILAKDTRKDLALLGSATPSNKIKPVKIAQKIPDIGEEVVAIGSPRGLSHTLSSGIISALRKDRTTELIQFTAPVSSGSSGGPLFNSKGEVIGVTTAMLNPSTTQNINFAVSCKDLSAFIKQNHKPSPKQEPTRSTKPTSTSPKEKPAQSAKPSQPQTTYLKANKSDIIFKREGNVYMSLNIGLKRRYEGLMLNVKGEEPIYFELKPCTFEFIGTFQYNPEDKHETEIYMVPYDKTQTYTKKYSDILKRGYYNIALLRNPKTYKLKWLLVTPEFSYKKTRNLIIDSVPVEANVFEFDYHTLPTITVSYGGFDPASNEFNITIFDNRKKEPHQHMDVNLKDLPKKIPILNGMLDVNKVDIGSESSPSVLHYKWITKPSL